MPQCPRLPPPAGAGFPRNSRTHTTAPTGGKGEGQSERPAGRLHGTSARRSRPAPPGTPALGTTKAGAEETAGPGRAAASPRPRRQLTVNLLRHQRVGKGVPEDLSDLRRETRPSGPDPTRPGPARPGRRALPGNRAPPHLLQLLDVARHEHHAPPGRRRHPHPRACALSRQSPPAAARRPATPSQWGKASAGA